MRKHQWREHFGGKHNILAKKYRERASQEKIQHTTKPKISLLNKIKIKAIMIMLWVYYRFKKN